MGTWTCSSNGSTLRGVVGAGGRHRLRDDLAGGFIHAKVERAPGAPLAHPVLTHRPLALAIHFQGPSSRPLGGSGRVGEAGSARPLGRLGAAREWSSPVPGGQAPSAPAPNRQSPRLGAGANDRSSVASALFGWRRPKRYIAPPAGWDLGNTTPRPDRRGTHTVRLPRRLSPAL